MGGESEEERHYMKLDTKQLNALENLLGMLLDGDYGLIQLTERAPEIEVLHYILENH